MDAFFASVEQLDDPRLRGKPVLVGGGERRGVVAAASYEARPFGVHSAMPMAKALRLCPDAIVVPPHRHRYEDVSAQVFAVFRRFTPLVEGLSVDEAFLDVTGSRGLFGEGPGIAARIRAEVREETGLTCSAGVAPSKFVAKIASDLDKPDGLTVVRADDVEAFLRPLPIEKMWGVGPKAAARLHSLGYRTIGDLANADAKRLEATLGVWGKQVSLLARGVDEREVTPGREAKSVGAEETYDEDLTDRADIERTLLVHATRIARRLVDGNLRGHRVTVKIKYDDFRSKTRQRRMGTAVSDVSSIYEAALTLLDRFPLAGRRVRLTGVSVGELVEGPAAPTLFEDPTLVRRRKVQDAVAQLRARFGDGGAVTRAELLRAPGRSASEAPMPRRLLPREED